MLHVLRFAFRALRYTFCVTRLMKLIVGLGNPGEKYQNNRHNVGFQFLDYLIGKVQSQSANRRIKFKSNKYLLSEIYEIPPNSSLLTPNYSPLLLAKPQTFMNHSGRAVKLLTTNYPLLTTDLIVVHDDLDIPLGKFKIQTGTGPQLHNGIDSINASLKTHDYLRIRIGVDARPPENRINGETRRRLVPGETYVLQNFTKEEQSRLPLIFNKLFERIIIEKIISDK
ncbi:hypothetical protein AUK04_05075 [Candidatus Roizmanbacteria bacterium CG2_30_33_16]|uniref:Peptidyl-tRNA hydrolase n=4 Tax=Candidatus Roizmaniibacteriota TaxID=1752723 RepID=A0A2M7E5D1_9BACT|nr:MAG: hypothetical protein AUK04_05075 [Candidatus Roizmanbacteria bacterium CG2_30_33_16]PIV62952.1 MAG: aminoacyl-tRNA hydrolase [Candidatus Roizmanbacteria bacterium CG01_land_8_20_14_3_00_33_9]PJB88114.1 MAG: aminoacyl-tRNA hydrolase [Candidatus Roizmanbacteria bacterium CG_4_9_14_0_8_um_filter_34_12]